MSKSVKAIDLEFYDIVLLDLNFDGDPRTGIEIFNKIHALDQGIDVVSLSMLRLNQRAQIPDHNHGVISPKRWGQLPQTGGVNSAQIGQPGLRLELGTYANNLVMSERKRFERAILSANGDRDEAAKLLGLSRATYYRRAKELGLIGRRLL